MSQPLDDSTLLLDRADRELQALEIKVAAFLGREPYRLVIKPNPEAETNEVVPKFSEQPDPQWRIDFGVIAGHIRSALDYIPAYLANPSDPDLSRTQFPIFSNETEYTRRNKGRRSKREQMLSGVPTKQWRIFDAQQPYKRRDDPKTGPLGVLAWATNAHKHRKLHAAVAAVENAIVKVLADEKPFVSVAIGNARFEEDVYLFGFTAPAKESVRIDYSFSCDITFGNRSVKTSDLRRSLSRAREIIEIFEPVCAPGVG